ncbi:MAG: serine/threonine-protein kinase [Rubripirellula sp.]|nr:serine/threonine protein kinase [Planctomycetaceae bacterium]MDF1843313.1 serine/threonine-protein kinase [Rubripirellula sp.]
MSEPSTFDASADRDQRLADVVAEVTDSICRGEIVDLRSTCQQHPDLADEITRLWGTILVTDVAAGSEDGTSASPSSKRWKSLTLPTIVGDYELIEELGRGGMGVVFRARQISLEREVAIKMILRGRLASEADLNRFLAEASASARLKHPNIVPVYDAGDVEGRPFFSMQLIEGQTLAERVALGVLPQREAASIVASVARAIAVAHENQVLHRDLKPSNILISEDGTPLVTDFGLAKQIGNGEELTRSGMMVGTPAYMSPEQASGRRNLVGPASDVYSLGGVLYYALTGRSPLVADTPMEMVMRVIEQDPTPPRALRPGMDRDLEMIVIRCLQKPIDLRYESAAALAKDLEAYLADERVAARSGRFNQVVARVFRETHHATVLQNWGKLWIWHSMVLLVAGLLTWQLDYRGVTQRSIYVALWTVGLGAWASVFWKLRQRMGPVTFIERQIAHVWGASMVAIAMLFPIEWWLDMPVLTLSPLLGVISAMVFIIKAGMLNGVFYIQAIALLFASFLMALMPPYAHLIFGFVSAACFFVPGFKYSRRRDEENAKSVVTAPVGN